MGRGCFPPLCCLSGGSCRELEVPRGQKVRNVLQNAVNLRAAEAEGMGHTGEVEAVQTAIFGVGVLNPHLLAIGQSLGSSDESLPRSAESRRR